MCDTLRKEGISRRIFRMSQRKPKKAGLSRRKATGAHKMPARRKAAPRPKKSAQEIANELALKAWKETYAKRHKFGKAA